MDTGALEVAAPTLPSCLAGCLLSQTFEAHLHLLPQLLPLLCYILQPP